MVLLTFAFSLEGLVGLKTVECVGTLLMEGHHWCCVVWVSSSGHHLDC